MNHTRQFSCSAVSPVFAAALALAAWLSLAASSHAGSSNSLMDISADGSLLACSNRDSGTVTIVDLKTRKVLREIRVGRHPEGVTFLGKSNRVAVANYDDDTVIWFDAMADGKERKSVEVFDEPYGVVSNADGSRLYVTLEYPGQVAEIDTDSAKITRTFDAGSFPRGIALTSDGKRLFVCEYLTAAVHSIDLKSGEIVDSWKAASTDNLARQLTVHPTRPKVYLSHMRSRVRAAHGAGSIFPYVSVVDDIREDGRRRKRIPMDAFQGNLVTSNPWEVALSPDAKSFYVVFAGTNDMFACRTVDDDYREIELARYVRLGANPRAVRVGPDGTVYVYNALDFAVVALDPRSLNPVAEIPVTENPLSDEIHLGKVLFYSALQPMVGRRWISCASCHPDGQPDGRTWHNPEGLRNTPPLGALAWTHPQHWSADRDETQDFEHTIRGLLMQGRGLIRGRVNPSLEDPNKGLSKELDALAAYTNSHRFTLSPYAKNGLSDAARRGQTIFHSRETKCAQCHNGPFYTDSQSGKPSRRHDVGTGLSDKSEKMGPKYDTPTLLGLYRTAPYLHHGEAGTLRDLLTTANRNDAHGKTSHLDEGQISDLVEFLKSLPFEDPEPAAREAGITPIVN